MIEKMIWVRPALDLVEFQAEDCVCAACVTRFSGELYCALPGTSYDQIGDGSNSRLEVDGFMGGVGDPHRGHGSCYEGGSFWMTADGFSGTDNTASISNLTIGEAYTFEGTNPFNQNLGIYDGDKTVTIGNTLTAVNGVFSGVSVGQWFKATWFSTGKDANNNNVAWHHVGLARVDSVISYSNANRS